MILFFSKLAKDDLNQIDSSISDNLSNPISSSKTVEGLINEISRLVDSPYLGTPIEFEMTGIEGYRVIRYKNFGAFYRIENETVFIHRILYLKRNYQRLLSK